VTQVYVAARSPSASCASAYAVWSSSSVVRYGDSTVITVSSRRPTWSSPSSIRSAKNSVVSAGRRGTGVSGSTGPSAYPAIPLPERSNISVALQDGVLLLRGRPTSISPPG
jgi:hypothetical protein